ncbi:uncharacterized protein LOC118631622 [Molossus molossus]|uniref:uncharacterized protein LOC118631622 n=1 Tax=Molossus molossus TaxID=27622 RepID=UPI00174779EF|nr:uncharacterized protein LOC118631622 [Molossus molossus]
MGFPLLSHQSRPPHPSSRGHTASRSCSDIQAIRYTATWYLGPHPIHVVLLLAKGCWGLTSSCWLQKVSSTRVAREVPAVRYPRSCSQGLSGAAGRNWNPVPSFCASLCGCLCLLALSSFATSCCRRTEAPQREWSSQTRAEPAPACILGLPLYFHLRTPRNTTSPHVQCLGLWNRRGRCRQPRRCLYKDDVRRSAVTITTSHPSDE